MKTYEILSNHTRNLEQQYISEILASHSNDITEIENLKLKILKLEKEILEIKEEKNENYQNKIKECLERENKLLSEIERLKTQLKDSNNKIDNNNMPASDNNINSSSNISKKDVSEIKASQKDILKNFNKFINSTENTLGKLEKYLEKNNFDTILKKLKEENDLLKDENFNLKKVQVELQEYKDKNVLLKDNLESKNRIIEEQKKKIEDLKNNSINSNIISNDVIKDDPWSLKNMENKSLINSNFNEKKNKKVNEKKIKSNNEVLNLNKNGKVLNENKIDPWTLTFPSVEPIVKKPKNVANKPKTVVNVESLIKDENKSFFNNLSFNNSSPVINEKKIKKTFK